MKPEICWQLPLRRVDEEQDDGSVISTLTEFGRAGWGEGGDDFAWWCTEEPEAFTGKEPVYRSLDAELRKTLGKKLHKQVVEYLDARFESVGLPARGAPRGGAGRDHPQGFVDALSAVAQPAGSEVEAGLAVFARRRDGMDVTFAAG